MYRGSRVRVKHTTSHLSWKRIGSSSSAALACGCMPSGNKRECLRPSCHLFGAPHCSYMPGYTCCLGCMHQKLLALGLLRTFDGTDCGCFAHH